MSLVPLLNFYCTLNAIIHIFQLCLDLTCSIEHIFQILCKSPTLAFGSFKTGCMQPCCPSQMWWIWFCLQAALWEKEKGWNCFSYDSKNLRNSGYFFNIIFKELRRHYFSSHFCFLESDLFCKGFNDGRVEKVPSSNRETKVLCKVM